MSELLPSIRRRSRSSGSPDERAGNIGLVLAETYPLLREGMERAFAGEAGFRVLASCEDGAEALRAVRRHRADILILDLDIPGDAFQTLGEIAADRLATRVVLFAARLDEAVMFDAMRLGVKGIVLKSMASRFLVQCVRKVHQGGVWVEKVSMGRAVEQLLRHDAAYRDAALRLGPRELDVVRLVTAGWSNKEIAEKLSISEGTVKAHLHHVYEKLGVRGRLELTLYARDKGLFSPIVSSPKPRP